MASNARIFFAGVGTTFIILAVGFGGGLMMAKTSLEPSGPSRPVADRIDPVRVVLPASAEAAVPPQAPASTVAPSEPQPAVLPAKQTQQAAEIDKQALERVERRKVEAEERARRRKHAERKARREAASLAREQKQQPRRTQAGILAFGRDDDQPTGGGFFGN